MQRLVLTLIGVATAGLLLGAPAGAHDPAKPVLWTGPALSVGPAKGAKLTIVHVLRGCHVWSVGSHRAGKAVVTLRRKGTLTIVNQDLDWHQLVQTAGPAVRLSGRPLHMMGSERVAFTKPGLYRFRTRKVEPGMHEQMPEIETIGPDWLLTLVVRVG